jgi:hypothetical protein
MAKELLSIAEVRALLSEAVTAAGNQSAWARQFGFSHSIVSNVLLSKRQPTAKILKALNLRKVVLYERHET